MYEWTGRRLSVLVVEDGLTNRVLLETLLRRLGHEVLLAEHGAAALELVHSHVPDVILMDIQMPVMDGLAATQAIRALDGPISRTPIVAVTANVSDGARELCLQAGMNDYIPKPVTPMVLLDLLKRWAGGLCGGNGSGKGCGPAFAGC